MTRCPHCHLRLVERACAEHGPMTVEAPAPPRSPPVIPGGWRLGAAVASGGSGAVWLVEAVDDGTTAVLKVAHSGDPDRRARFAEEARLLAHVGGPWVPAVLAASGAGDWPYLVLERIDGETLADRLARGRLALPAAGGCLLAIARAVAGLHARGVAHLDLKPENLMLVGDEVRLLDLGLARLVGSDRAPSGAGGGTAHYAAPEQRTGAEVGTAADVYALGAIGYELIGGRPPFVGELRELDWGHRLVRPALLPRPAPPAIAALIARCLAKAPAVRPTIAELVIGLASSVLEPVGSMGAADRVAPLPPAAVGPRRLREPAALIWTAADDHVSVVRRVVAAGGRVLRDRPEGVLLGFLADDHARPLAAALAVARELARLAPTALHLALVTLGGRGPRRSVHGEAVDHPAGWCPRETWTGLVITPPARQALPELADADPAAAVSAPSVPPAILADVERALAATGPRLITLVGGHGVGKSTACASIAATLAGRGLDVIAVGGRAVVDGLAATGHALAARLARHPGLTWLDRLRHAAADGVAVIIDDGHRVEDDVLDRLEIAAGWSGVRLAIVVAAHPDLLRGRPRWSEARGLGACHALAPLGPDDAHALLRARLAPARRVPDGLLTQLAAPAGGNPGALVAIAAELHRRGAIRRFPGSDEWYVAADAIVLEPTADVRWQAARELARLPPAMARFVELCAVLEPGGDHAELEAVVTATGGDGEVIDAAAGLAWLVDAGLACPGGQGSRLRSPAIALAMVEQVEPARRRAIHRAALTHWQQQPGDGVALAAIAHHASQLDEHHLAATAYVALAGRARRQQAPVEAVRLASLAIEASAGRDPRIEARAHVERGLARRPLTHYEDARADFAAALALAGDDPALRVRALVGDGEVCDFTDRLAESAAAIAEAARLAPADLDRATRARLDNWLGVVAVRRGLHGQALTWFTRALDLALAVDDHETVVGATLMLASLRRQAGSIGEALALLETVLVRCQAASDVFHLTVALFNRINAWMALDDVDRAEADAAAAIELCERHGYGQMEIAGWNNLRALRFKVGRVAGAHQAAEQAYGASRRRFARPMMIATLHLAALEAGLGRPARAASLLAEVEASDARAASTTAVLARATDLAITTGLDAGTAAVLALEAPDVDEIVAWLAQTCGAVATAGRAR